MTRSVSIILLLMLTGCGAPVRPATNSAQGYGAASETVTLPDGSQTVTITPPTPAEEALASWVKYGAIMGAIGILAMLPAFGGNIRTGAVIAAGGAGMAAVGHFLGSITIEIPVWFLPAVLVLTAAGMVWGYYVSEGQKE